MLSELPAPWLQVQVEIFELKQHILEIGLLKKLTNSNSRIDVYTTLLRDTWKYYKLCSVW